MEFPRLCATSDSVLDVQASKAYGVASLLGRMSGIASYDVWSAFSMSYNNGELRAPPLAIPDAQLSPFLGKKKSRWITAKRAEAPADDVDKQAISACDPALVSHFGNPVGDQIPTYYVAPVPRVWAMRHGRLWMTR